MTDDAHKWWYVAAKLRRALGLAPPSLEEADAQMSEAEGAPMTDEEIERIADSAICPKKNQDYDLEPDYTWTEEFATEEVADEMLVLNRDAGEEDPEVDQRIDRLREEALHDDEEDDQTRLEADGA